MDIQVYRFNKVRSLGFEPTILTVAKIDAILFPFENPETYYQDGEVSPEEALQIWKKQLKEAGFGITETNQAVDAYGF